jgi:hypothetical protein
MTVGRRNSTTSSLAEWRRDRESIEELDRQLRSRRPRKRNIKVTPEVVDALENVFEALDGTEGSVSRSGGSAHETRARVETRGAAHDYEASGHESPRQLAQRLGR